jgi:hypothetical protein
MGVFRELLHHDEFAFDFSHRHRGHFTNTIIFFVAVFVAGRLVAAVLISVATRAARAKRFHGDNFTSREMPSFSDDCETTRAEHVE